MGQRKSGRKRTWVALFAIFLVIALAAVGVFLSGGNRGNLEKPVILYVNQGNGLVTGSGFGTMLTVASSHGFNTIFFQVYRQGTLLFDAGTLRSFVNQTHESHMALYFAIFITNSSQTLPSVIYSLHEDGISLDMSSLDVAIQKSLLASLKVGFSGKTAVTTLDFQSTLRPDLLILETYNSASKAYIRQGIVGSVAAYATSNIEDYQAQVQYALDNSDGVMVFDYHWLVQNAY